MINRLSNPINRNRSAAKISKVMSSTHQTRGRKQRTAMRYRNRGKYRTADTTCFFFQDYCFYTFLHFFFLQNIAFCCFFLHNTANETATAFFLRYYRSRTTLKKMRYPMGGKEA